MAVTAEMEDKLSTDAATVNVHAQFRAPDAVDDIVMHHARLPDEYAILIIVRKALCSLKVLKHNACYSQATNQL
jgi:hypothetical protein